MDEGPLCASLVPAQVRERKWRRALPQRRGRAGGWPQGRGGRLPRSPHPQPPRSFSAPGTQGRRGPAPLGGARQRPRSARWLRPRDWCPASRVASPPGHDGSRRPAGSSALGLWASPSHRGPWVLFEPQPGVALPLSARGQPSPPPTCWGLGKRRWEEVGAWGPHASRGGREVRGGGAPQPGCGQAPEERGVAPSLGTSRRRRPSLGRGRPLIGRLWAADGGASFPSASRSQNASSARLRVPGWRFGGGRGALPQFPQARCFSMAPPPPWGPTPSLRSAGI